VTSLRTFKDFLTGDSKLDIRQKCAPFLEQAGNRPLYRGYGGPFASLVKGAREVTVRKDRKPRDSTPFVHGLLDTYFQKKFGVKVRSEGLFATGDKNAARLYGQLHYVFPVGDFKFVWGEHNGEAIYDTMRWARTIENLMRVSKEEEAEGVAAKVLDEITWHDDNLAKAISSGAEIALLCDSVIIVPVRKDVDYEDLIAG
jgi:hypothetical protein